MKKHLFTFTGFHDPYSIGLIGESEQPGPVLSLLSEMPFDVVTLLSTPKMDKPTKDTEHAISKIFPNVSVNVIDFKIEDPTNYLIILENLRECIPIIMESDEQMDYYISVASGTPQMHACWILLTASGEIPAHVLNVRPPKYVTKDKPRVCEIDLAARDFPTVRAPVTHYHEQDLLELNEVVKSLGIVGDHPKMKQVLEQGAMLAPSMTPILIFGETGTGKELIARLIHQLSGRLIDKFYPMNCAAIPQDLVESILFGHKKGSFTGDG